MKHFQSTIALLLLFVLMFTVSAPALAQGGGARVYLQPVASPDQTLTVDVMLENVTNLYGAEFRLKYDPAVLAVQDLNPQQEGVQIQPGAFLPSDNGKGFVVANKVDEAAGQIVFALTLLNPTPAVSGQGALARVTFKVLQNTPATINVEHAKLVASNLQTIPSETAALTIGNNNQAVAAAPTPASASGNFPWWIVAVLVLGLGVALLAGLIIVGAGKARAAATATPPQQPVKPQSAPVKSAAAQVSRRPSAFNQPGDLKQKP